MTEQTSFSQLTDEGIQNDVNDESEAGSSAGQSTPDSGESSSDVTKLVAPAVEQWVTEREQRKENYGYFHLFVVAKSDLTGVERQLHYKEKLDQRVSEDDSNRQYGGRWGRGGIHIAEVRDQLIDWKLTELATPHHPDLRTILAENLRIFVAAPARDLLDEHNIEIDALVDTLNALDEHQPTDEQLARRREYSEVRKAVMGHQAPLNQRVRAIEATIRARFGFSHRFSGEIPDPHPDYQELDPTALKKELESARTELEQTEQRKDDLHQEIADEETQWIEEIYAELFA